MAKWTVISSRQPIILPYNKLTFISDWLGGNCGSANCGKMSVSSSDYFLVVGNWCDSIANIKLQNIPSVYIVRARDTDESTSEWAIKVKETVTLDDFEWILDKNGIK